MSKKQLMLGNDAVAQGLYDAGVCVASSYPGTPSTEVTETLAEFRDIYTEWAPNEKVAFEVAFGASLGGVRSFCAMKHVGLNVAADPLFTMSYTGVGAGLVVVVADDPGMHSSQNEQDSRHYAIASKVPMLEPSDSRECYEYAKAAFEISERFDTPVLLRLCTRVSHSQSLVETTGRGAVTPKMYARDLAKYVMMPGNAKRRHPIVENRTRALIEYAETSPLNSLELGECRELGIICSGTAYQYVREVLGEGASVLKLGLVNPLPEKLIRDFADAVDSLIVIEELDPVIENHVKTLGIECHGKDMFPLCDEFSQNLVARILDSAPHTGSMRTSTPTDIVAIDAPIPARPPVMCAGCPHRGMFYTLSKNKVRVFGDIGCYTLGAAAPLAAIDTTLCMGASVTTLHGYTHAQAFGDGDDVKTACVIGDSTFMHSGVTGLINTAYNGGASTVIILDNSITGMTGHQQNPTTGLDIHGDPAGKIDLEALCRAIGITRVRVVDPYNLAECEAAVTEETAADELSVIISRRPCALLKTVKAKPPLTVNAEKCVKCKACMKIGCPAISMTDDGAVIDDTLCVGCGVCAQLCKFGALEVQA
ncbi:MAG: indolepyruvate ferredoxin oxidoreductase subunit alpha [Oscillospiraceae bacterium]|jgi:indolepyruvate ferredoxin oxidoreductase alpha subunit|nr:indolepyruvate ferredoxin oxidoreductase subunit alpha [Oscillospiraceae bacterium]